jgi:hypothetical protein
MDAGAGGFFFILFFYFLLELSEVFQTDNTASR